MLSQLEGSHAALWWLSMLVLMGVGLAAVFRPRWIASRKREWTEARSAKLGKVGRLLILMVGLQLLLDLFAVFVWADLHRP